MSMLAISRKERFEEILRDIEAESFDSRLSSSFFDKLRRSNQEEGRKTWLTEDFFSPSNIPFLIPTNPLFLYEIYDLEVIRYIKYAMARDGLYGVMNFFHRFPSPEGIRTTLIIQERFHSVVPKAWREQVVYFRYQLHLDDHPAKEVDTLFVKGICAPSAYSNEYCNEQINLIKELNIKTVHCHLPVKKDIFSPRRKNDPQYYQLFEGLYRHTNASVEYLEWQSFCNKARHGRFIDLNQGLSVLSDDYLTNVLLSRGCQPLELKEVSLSSDEKYLPVTKYHGIVLSMGNVRDIGAMENEIAKMKRLLNPGRTELFKSDFAYYMRDLAWKILPEHTWQYHL